ncbi:MAG: DUF192 domain-containing protein [Endomicrobium sp.]|jgi:uncharacterized membrane protein (UPF0127 family)|nr:DUF192 domain-containing protein [Endomicrobium sp.]
MKKVAAIVSVLIVCGIVIILCTQTNKGTIDNPAAAVQDEMQDGAIIKTQVGENQLNLILAKSSEASAKGLSDRTEIPQDGMLFVFDEPQILVFWMKDMLIPIDIVWIGSNTVLGFSENAQPEYNAPDIALKRYYSPENTDTAIEIKAGAVKKLNIKKGDAFSMK